jgi:hypothetical protein
VGEEERIVANEVEALFDVEVDVDVSRPFMLREGRAVWKVWVMNFFSFIMR